MPRLFNGTSDIATVTYGNQATYATVIGAVSDGKLYSHPKTLLLANGSLLIFFSTNEDNTGSGNYIQKMASSSDNGLTWGSHVTIGTTPSPDGHFEASAVQFDDGTILVVYEAGNAVVQKTSTDNGATWSSESSSFSAGSNQPHPHIVKTGASSAVVVYADTSGIGLRTTSNKGTTWSAKVTVTSDSVWTPYLAICPNGDYLVVTSAVSTIVVKTYRSTNSGASFGSAVTVFSDPDGITAADCTPCLLTDGSTLWMTFSYGPENVGLTPGSRVCCILASQDSGSTWSTPTAISTLPTFDTHRAMIMLISGSIVGFCCQHDSDYHVNRFTLPAATVARGRAGTLNATIENLTKYTAWAWIKHSTTYNGAGNEYILGHNGLARVYLQLKNNSGAEFHTFVNKTTTNTDYKTAANPVGYSASTWTFIAVTYDDTAGAGAKAQFYVGTTSGNLASVTTSVVTEGSGNQVLSINGPLTIGGKYNDTARIFNGDIGPCGVASGVLTLTQMKHILDGCVDPAVVGAWDMVGTSTETDFTGYANNATLSGTTASGTSPTPNSYTAQAITISGPASGSVGVTSTAFTASLGTNAAFNGFQTITVTASDGTISATAASGSISGNGTGTVIVTPANAATSFTFTYTPATSGTKTLTYTNGQGWTNPANSSYSSNGTSGFTLTAPGTAHCLPGVQSGNFTVATVSGITVAAQTIVTPHSNGTAGTWAPSSLTFSGETTSLTTKFTPDFADVSGTVKTMSITNDQSLTNGGTVSFTVDPVNNSDIRSGVGAGTLVVPSVNDVRSGTTFDNGSTGVMDLPAVANVKSGTIFDHTTKTGTCVVPAAADVRDGTSVSLSAGTLVMPDPSDVRSTATFDNGTSGTLVVPTATNVRAEVVFDNGTNGTLILPSPDDVRYPVRFDTLIGIPGTLHLPAAANVRSGTQYGANGTEFTGSLSGGSGVVTTSTGVFKSP